MLVRTLVCGLLLTLLPHSLVRADDTPAPAVGWYNGDCYYGGIGGWANWYQTNQQFTRVYDEFLVPAGGWSVAGVFSNNQFMGSIPVVTLAAWEIRSGLAQGSGGTVVASGVGPAAQIHQSSLIYRIEVDGLQFQLPPGQYWLNVTPVGTVFHQSYVCQTQGQSAVGSPPGNGTGYYSMDPAVFNSLSASDGTTLNFSQGVLIDGISQPPPSVPAQWQADVASLVQQMPALHSLPYPGIGLDDFNAHAQDLYNRIPLLSDAEIRTDIEELVASIEDPHTDVGWPSPSPFRQVPLSFYWFDDGIYVTAASAKYKSLLGAKLLTVGQTGIDDAARILTALVAHDNGQWIKHRIPLQELTNADFLFGKGLISSLASVPLEAQTFSNGVPDAVISADVSTYTALRMPSQMSVFQGVPPLYRQRPGWNYWATVIDNGATVYFQYNSCMEDTKQPSVQFFQQLDALMAQPGVQRVVVDMRNNSGGLTGILSPWFKELRSGRFNQHGRLYVIVGRATFSAAMEATDNFHDETAAIFVGEPTGAKPQFLLRRGDFALPYQGIKVSYSSGLEGASDPGDALYPDIPTGLTFQQYMDGIDPALDAILAIPPPA